MALYSDQWLYSYIRLLVGCEIVEQPRVYDVNSADFIVRDTQIDTSQYTTVGPHDHALTDGQSVEIH